MFIDKVKIKLKAGNGGDGLVAFRREKYVALGGPAGGDGGDGGSIIFKADTNKSTLLDLRFTKQIFAENGEKGKTKKMHGASKPNIIVKVPVGTIVKDLNTNELLADLSSPNEEAVICKGGKGGNGNWHYASGRNSAPEYAQMGTLGESREVVVELKLLADVGLVGFPSVGKSTLLSMVSKAKPEIADYHFTTLRPQLGLVRVPDGYSFVMADLPGLIEGAADGKGLGHEFLKHIERCRVILHMVDMGACDGRDPLSDYEIINKELEKYPSNLEKRPQVVIANKMDLDDAQENLRRFKEKYPDVEVFETTTIINEGINPVLYRLEALLKVTPAFPMLDEKEAEEEVVYKFEPKNDSYKVFNEGNGLWRIEGEKVERLFANVNFDDYDSVLYFSRTLRNMGIDDELRNRGCKDGDRVYIKDYGFEFIDEE